MSAEYNDPCSSLQHSIKHEVKYEEGCFIKSEIKDEADVVYAEVKFEAESKENIKCERKCEDNPNIKTEDDIFYECVSDFNTTNCNDNGFIK